MGLALIGLVVLSAVSLAAVYFFLRHPAAHEHAQDRPEEVHVRVSGGYVPDTIVGRAGWPLRVVFHREESASCSERVVFPELGKSAMLPVGEDTVVDLLPQRPGQYEFTCQLGMLHGRLIVAGPGPEGQNTA